MAIINFAHREIITSIVYFGAPGSGTTSNVRYLYDNLPTEKKAASITSLPTTNIMSLDSSTTCHRASRLSTDLQLGFAFFLFPEKSET